jgi:phosphoribosylaminoimidazolecarboxamide formyltransferase/IMP cyclohydrolase
MSEAKRIKTALVSVYHKEGLDEIITKLHEEGVEFLSTGGTRQFIESLGFPCKAVEDLTTYPSILGGRVKTLHPKVFGGILCRRGLEQDMQQIEKYEIPEIDLVIVDLYPFEATVASGAEEQAIIEKIDIGGISYFSICCISCSKPRRHKIPPKTLGCSVFTRPPKIEG